MKKLISLIIPIIFIMILSSCLTTAELGQELYNFNSKEVMVMSRGVKIPATVVYPISEGSVKFPLVVMAHGHGGGRQENGGFGLIAEKLAAAGIVSIRMDFPGCGDSTESFRKNNLTNMLMDIESSRAYALENFTMIDKKRVGIMGYSMGGRLAIHSASMNPGMWKVMGHLAPSADNGGSADFLGGPEIFQERKKVAEKDGFYLFVTPWGQKQELGHQFYVDMEQSEPQNLIKDYKGPIIVVSGDKDNTVPTEIGKDLLANADKASSTELHIVKGANHGYGFYSDEKHLALEVANTLVDFFIANF